MWGREALAPSSREGQQHRLLWLLQRWRTRKASRLRARHLFALRDELADRPGTANVTVQVLSAMLSWAVGQGYLEFNPCLGHPELLSKPRRSYDAWTEADIALLRQSAPPAVWHVAALTLATAQPLPAALAFTWADVVDNALRVARDDHPIVLPIRGALARLIAGLPRVSDHLLSDAAGRPWTPWRFRDAWRQLLRDARLAPLRDKHLAFCGLRRTAITRMVAAGCSRMEVTAVTGLTWETLTPYFERTAQGAAAASAIAKWERAGHPDDTVNGRLQRRARRACH